MLWTAAAAALPVLVTVLVLVVLTLGVLVFSDSGFDSLFAVVAVEWLVVNRVPLTVDAVELGFLPLLPPLIYVAILARQTRAVLADVDQPGGREAGAAVAGATVAGVLLTGLASLLVGSSASDFAVREFSLPVALLWTAAVGLLGSGIGVWLFFRRELREILPLWVRGGIHLGVAFAVATWAIAATLVLVGILFAWEPIAASLEIGKGFVGTAALTGISVAYLPNVVMAGAALVVGGEAHLGEASYSVFAVSRGPMPEVPLAAALPTTSPHWVVQVLLLVTVLVAAGLARSVAHWFRTTADAVKAAWLAAAIVAAVMAISPVVAGGQLGALGSVGTGGLIAAVMALLLFGIIGSTTIALSLAGLTRRRERAESELARRRRRVGGVAAGHDGDPLEHADGGDGSGDDEHADGGDGSGDEHAGDDEHDDEDDDEGDDYEASSYPVSDDDSEDLLDSVDTDSTEYGAHLTVEPADLPGGEAGGEAGGRTSEGTADGRGDQSSEAFEDTGKTFEDSDLPSDSAAHSDSGSATKSDTESDAGSATGPGPHSDPELDSDSVSDFAADTGEAPDDEPAGADAEDPDSTPADTDIERDETPGVESSDLPDEHRGAGD